MDKTLMTKKRTVIIIMAMLLLITVCFSACSSRGDVEVYLDWGSYRQTVKVKYGSVINAETVPYIGFDFIEGLYYDVTFTKEYNGQRIKQDTVIYIKSNNQYPLEKKYCNVSLDENFVETDVSLIMNVGFRFDEEFKLAVIKSGVDVVYVDDRFSTAGENFVDADKFRQGLSIKLSTNSKEKVIEAIQILEKFPQIYYAGPNRYLELEQSSNDPRYNMQWGLDKINIQTAWNITTGSSNVKVGVIDTGISDHEDLNSNVIEGYDFFNNNNITNDVAHPHGTKVAGIIGATGNNGVGISGINWNVSIVPLQISNDSGGINEDACVRAVEYATATYKTSNPIKILNFSIGGNVEWPRIEDAIRAYPGLFVCSTGNSGGNNDTTHHYPSFYGSSLSSSPLNNIIAVGRSDVNDVATSNYGKNTVNLFAPGQYIFTTTTNGYIESSGSSFAAPHVAGVAALILSKYPSLTTAQLKSAIINSVDKVDGLTDKCISGGRLNAYKALKNAHVHNYSKDYTWINTKQHTVNCECGATVTQGHAVSANQSPLPTREKLCLFCGGRADYGFVKWEPNSEGVKFVTDNGSFILPNGIVVLVDEDIQAYIDGTLKFYDKNTVKE